MPVNILTREDLNAFKEELMDHITELLTHTKPQKLWLRSSEVRKLLNISPGTLNNYRVNGTLSSSKIGGTVYYNYKDIEKLMETN